MSSIEGQPVSTSIPNTDGEAFGPALGGYFSGARLLVSDTRVTLLLLNEARNHTIKRLFGTPREDSTLVTIIAVGVLSAAVRDKTAQLLKGPNPSLADTMLGIGVANEYVRGIAGVPPGGSVLFSALVAMAVVGAAVRPVARASWRGAKSMSHHARADFDHRYGHLIRSNRPRPAAASRSRKTGVR
jgi:hypothetical protein